MDNNTVNICMILDANYVNITLMCINSIIESKDSDTYINFYVFGDKIDKDQMLKFLTFSNDKVKIHCYVVSSDSISINTHRHLTSAMYLKFFIPQMVKDLDKILFLDCDLLVKKDLKSLYNIDLGDKLIGGVRDLSILRGNNRKTDINTGVMLLNLKKIRKTDFISKCLEAAEKIKQTDQEAINCVCKDDIKYIEPIYNLSYHRIIQGNIPQFNNIELWNQVHDTSYKSISDLKDKSVIWHFHGDKKELLKDKILKSIYDNEFSKIQRIVNKDRK